MKSLSKILSIGILSLISLTGCMKSYKTDKECITYNQYLTTPMVVYRDTAKIKYNTSPFIYTDHRVTGEEITKISVAKEKKSLFPRRTKKYALFPKEYSIKNKEDSAMIRKEKKNFDRYLKIIDSVENEK